MRHRMRIRHYYQGTLLCRENGNIMLLCFSSAKWWIQCKRSIMCCFWYSLQYYLYWIQIITQRKYFIDVIIHISYNYQQTDFCFNSYRWGNYIRHNQILFSLLQFKSLITSLHTLPHLFTRIERSHNSCFRIINVFTSQVILYTPSFLPHTTFLNVYVYILANLQYFHYPEHRFYGTRWDV